MNRKLLLNELAGLQEYIHFLQQIENEETNIYELSESKLAYLENYAQTHTGRGTVFANNILCELYGICIEENGEKVKVEERGDEMMRRLDDEMMNKRGGSLDKITLVPNPTTGELRIENYELRIKNVEVFDLYGRKQKAESRKQKGEGSVVIDLSQLAAGIYFVKVYTENGIFFEKVIKN